MSCLYVLLCCNSCCIINLMKSDRAKYKSIVKTVWLLIILQTVQILIRKLVKPKFELLNWDLKFYISIYAIALKNLISMQLALNVFLFSFDRSCNVEMLNYVMKKTSIVLCNSFM